LKVKDKLASISLEKNILLNFLANIWGSILGIIVVPYNLKYIGAEGYGLIGVFTSLQVVLGLLDSGLSTTLNKELARLSVLANTETQMRNLVKTLGTLYWIIAIIAGLIAVGLSPFISNNWVQANTLSNETVTYAFMLLGISIIFQFPIGFYSGGLFGLNRQASSNILRVIFGTLRSLGGVLILMFYSPTVIAFFSWILLVSLVQAYTFRWFVWHHLPISAQKTIFDKQELKSIWKFAAGMSATAIAVVVLTQIDKVILSKLLTLEAFGYYSIAATIAGLTYQVIAPITQSYFPIFSSLKSQGDTPNLILNYHKGSQLISAILIPAALILALYSKEIILIWTNNPITVNNTWLLVTILTIGNTFHGLVYLPYMLTLAYDWTKFGLYLTLGMLTVMLPTITLTTLKYQSVGAASCWSGIAIVYFIIAPLIIHKRILRSEVKSWYWNDNIKLMLSSFLFIGICRTLLPIDSLDRWSKLFALFMLGFVSVVINLFVANDIKPMLYFNNLKK
jgi:O-antigen/teichoic acid export membrane protein